MLDALNYRIEYQSDLIDNINIKDIFMINGSNSEKKDT